MLTPRLVMALLTMQRLFRAYKETPQAFWGFVMNFDDLESQLMIYLEDRAKNIGSSKKKTAHPMPPSWFAVLFAVLAVGSQYNESPYCIRVQRAEKYVQTSCHFLRVGNFLLRCASSILLSEFLLLITTSDQILILSRRFSWSALSYLMRRRRRNHGLCLA